MVVDVEDLSVRFLGDENYVLKGVTFRVKEGEFVIIMGPSGCGKTTLCYCLNGIIPNTIKAEVLGRIDVLGVNPTKAPPSKMAMQVGLVFQNPDMQLVTSSVFEEIAFPMENLCFPPNEIKRRIDEILLITGLKGLENRHPHSLSGGQKQALAIASVLALRPKLLILDEPTSQLDPEGTKRITDLILRLREELNITVIAVEHRVEWAAEHADRIIVMEDGRIVIDDLPEKIFFRRFDVEKVGFRYPQVTEIAYRLLDKGIAVNQIPVTLAQGVKVFGEVLMRHRP